jgi:hypothetical protein
MKTSPILTVALPIAQFLLLVLTLYFAVLARKARGERNSAELFVPKYHPGRMTRVLVRLGGVHAEELEGLGPGCYWRHSVCGLMIFIAAGMGYCGMLMWMGQFRSAGPVTGHLVAFGVAAVVFALDLGLVTSLSDASGRRAIFFVLLRAAVAIALGYWLAKPYLVLIYADQIAAEQRKAKKVEILAAADKAYEARQRFGNQQKPMLDEYKKAADELHRRMELVAPALQGLRERYAELHRQYVEEVTKGQNGRRDGRGTYAKFIEDQMAAVQKEVNAAVEEESGLKAEAARLAKENESVVAKVFADPQFAATAQAIDQIIKEAADSKADSLGQQQELLEQYVAAEPRRRWNYWMFHLLLILLDTAPVFTKLFMPRDDYKLAAKMRHERLAAEVKADGELAVQFATERAKLKHDAEMRRTRLAALAEEADALFQAVAHIGLTHLQAQVEMKKTYKAIVRRMVPEENNADANWLEVAKPLARAQTHLLGVLASLIDGAAGETSTHKSRNGLN